MLCCAGNSGRIWDRMWNKAKHEDEVRLLTTLQDIYCGCSSQELQSRSHVDSTSGLTGFKVLTGLTTIKQSILHL